VLVSTLMVWLAARLARSSDLVFCRGSDLLGMARPSHPFLHNTAGSHPCLEKESCTELDTGKIQPTGSRNWASSQTKNNYGFTPAPVITFLMDTCTSGNTSLSEVKQFWGKISHF